MNNLRSQKCSELRSHSQYNVQLSIITSLEQRETVLRREKCDWSLSYSRHRIISSIAWANKTVCKFPKQASNGHYSNQIPKSFSSFIYIDTASCRNVKFCFIVSDSERIYIFLVRLQWRKGVKMGVVAPPRKLFPNWTKVSLRTTHDWRIKFKRASEIHSSEQVLHFPLKYVRVSFCSRPLHPTKNFHPPRKL